MFLSHYGLREQPFGVTPNPRFLYESDVHREALASLMYGIESDIGFTALIAAPGMGKTTLLYHLLERYSKTSSTAFLFETQSTSRELLRALLNEFELDINGGDTVLHERFKRFLVAQARSHRRVLVFLDEAQNLDRKVLETVRLLSNFETSASKLLHIVIAGQPQLEAKLARPEMAQLRQRIAMFTRLAAFSPEETAAYITHRLVVAGYRGNPLFTPNALAVIAAETRGVPREINRLCFNALSLGYAEGKHVIDAEMLVEVCADLRVNPAHEYRAATAPTPHETAHELAVENSPEVPRHEQERCDDEAPEDGAMSAAIANVNEVAAIPVPFAGVEAVKTRAAAEVTPFQPPDVVNVASPSYAGAAVPPPAREMQPSAANDFDADPFRNHRRPQPDWQEGRWNAAVALPRPADSAPYFPDPTGVALNPRRKPVGINLGHVAGLGLVLPIMLWFLMLLVIRYHLLERLDFFH